MIWSLTRVCGIALIALFTSSSLCLAGKFNSAVDIGQVAPEWKELESAQGGSGEMSTYKDAKVIVIVFTCNSCPVALAYEERLKEFASANKEKGVALVAIHVHRSETAKDAAAHAEEMEFNFPYLHDESQETSKAYGASTTPHVFVLDQARKIAYMGAFDDNMDPAEVQHQYVQAAVDALLKGDSPSETETRQFGCGVKWK